MSDVRILQGEAVAVLKTLPADSVHCCITSPPYFGLRSYLPPDQPDKGLELGMERTVQEYVAQLVDAFRQVRRVLHPSGTLWLNIADSYATGAGKVGNAPGGGEQGERWKGHRGARGASPKHSRGAIGPITQPNRLPQPGLKPKDLCMVPARVALALQEDGWYLRSDCIWSKPNPMPESVKDRPTRSHEYIFLLTKSEVYFYDYVAVLEPTRRPGEVGHFGGKKRHDYATTADDPAYRNGHEQWRRDHTTGFTRNRRTVMTVATRPFAGSHFAVFPEALIEPPLLAGTSEAGCCPTCLTPWRRITERLSAEPLDYEGKWRAMEPQASGRKLLGNTRARRELGFDHDNPFPAPKTTGWEPGCACGARAPTPCTVLDCFAGSGTTLSVAVKHNRNAVGIELNPAYIELIHKRLAQTQVTLPLDVESA